MSHAAIAASPAGLFGAFGQAARKSGACRSRRFEQQSAHACSASVPRAVVSRGVHPFADRLLRDHALRALGGPWWSVGRWSSDSRHVGWPVTLSFSRLWRSSSLQALLIVAAIVAAVSFSYSPLRALAWLAVAQFLLYAVVTLTLGRLPGDSAPLEGARQSSTEVRTGGFIVLLFGLWMLAWLIQNPTNP